MAMGRSNSNIIRGTFSPDSSGVETISFGQTLNRYIAYFELTEESKEQFAANVKASNYTRTYGVIGMHWGGCDDFSDTIVNYLMRYNGSTVSGAHMTASIITQMNSDNLKVVVAAFSGNISAFYPGYTYNYIICPID